MLSPAKIIEKARHSTWYRRLLNLSLNRLVPFNKPHGFRVVELESYAVKVLLPYRKRNLNHIRGLHACALATVSEFSTGLVLISQLNPREYRLIMQRLEMDYHYQGRTDAYATFRISEEWLRDEILQPLESSDAVVTTRQVLVHDASGNHLTTGRVYWQIKKWSAVRKG